MNTRSLEITAFNIPFDVTFEYEHHTDEHAQGYEAVIMAINVADSKHDILDLLTLEATGEIRQQIINKLAAEARDGGA